MPSGETELDTLTAVTLVTAGPEDPPAPATASYADVATESRRLADGLAALGVQPGDRVAMARVALLVGTDPKQVMELFLDPVRKAQPEFRESYLVLGELALGKSDYALAAKTFAGAAKKFPEDADMWFGLARAYAPSDPESATEWMDSASIDDENVSRNAMNFVSAMPRFAASAATIARVPPPALIYE